MWFRQYVLPGTHRWTVYIIHFICKTEQILGPKGKDGHRDRAENKSNERYFSQPWIRAHHLVVEEIKGYKIHESHVDKYTRGQGAQQALQD